jgi:oxygen-independent coproporphyrinogen-3 oxidase
MSGIYLHIPFCHKACHYCDFHFSTNQQLKTSVLKAMIKEIGLRKDDIIDPIETIYLGGGTPSLLSIEELQFLFDSIRAKFQLDELKEVTLEANPEDITRDRLQSWHQLGINRLSVGIQTFDDNILSKFNRNHSSQLSKKAIDSIKKSAIEEVSYDLIFGSPWHSDGILQKDIDLLLESGCNHISTYGMTIEPDTVFGKWHEKGKLSPLEDDKSSQQFEQIMNRLQFAGFEQYEVSNFAKNGMISRHNSNYWRQVPFLGIGPSAHGLDKKGRYANIASNPKYIKALEQGILPEEREVLDQESKFNERLLTGLRTKWGFNLTLINGFDEKKQDVWLKQVTEFTNLGFIKKQGNNLLLTQKGILLADSITMELFLPINFD